jgi:hypothetical protein
MRAIRLNPSALSLVFKRATHLTVEGAEIAQCAEKFMLGVLCALCGTDIHIDEEHEI